MIFIPSAVLINREHQLKHVKGNINLNWFPAKEDCRIHLKIYIWPQYIRRYLNTNSSDRSAGVHNGKKYEVLYWHY